MVTTVPNQSLRNQRAMYWTCVVMTWVCVFTFFQMDMWSWGGFVIAVHAGIWWSLSKKVGRQIHDEKIRLARDAERRELIRSGKLVDLAALRYHEEGGNPVRTDSRDPAHAVGGGHVRSGASPAIGNVAEPQVGPAGSSAPTTALLASPSEDP